MDTGTISVRYARALLKYAIELGEEYKVYSDMDVLAKVYLKIPQLRSAIESPSLTAAEKQKLLCEAAGGNPCGATQRFFQLVAHKRRTEFMQFIANSYMSLYLAYKHIVKGKLTVSTKINEETASKIQKLVESHTGNTVEIEITTNPAIGGGFILEFGSYRIDASIGNQVKTIRKSLMQAAGNI